jgi:hypothetical protein
MEKYNNIIGQIDDILVNKITNEKFIILNLWYHVDRHIYVYTLRNIKHDITQSFSISDVDNYYNLIKRRNSKIKNILDNPSI